MNSFMLGPIKFPYLTNFEVFFQEINETDDIIRYKPHSVVDNGNRETFMFGNTEDGKKVDEEKLINPHIPRRRRDGKAQIQQRAHKGDITKINVYTEHESNEIESNGHREPGAKRYSY